MTRDEVEGIVEGMIAAANANRPRLWTDWRFVLGVPASVVALSALWVTFGFPTVATNYDLQRVEAQSAAGVRRVERSQAEIAIQAYQNAINNLLANTPSKDAPVSQQRAWQQQLDQMNKALDRSIRDKIELSK